MKDLTVELLDAAGATLAELPAEYVGGAVRFRPGATALGAAAGFRLIDESGQLLLERPIDGALELFRTLRTRFDAAPAAGLEGAE